MRKEDDEWLPEKLEKQLKKFNECDENTGLVYCGVYWLDESKNTMKEAKHAHFIGNVYHELMLGDFVWMCSIPLIRTKYLKEVGGFDELMPARQDWECWLRIAKKYKFNCVEEPLIIYHARHGEHIGDDLTRWIIGIKRIMEKHKDYIKQNKDVERNMFFGLSEVYVIIGDYKNFFATWLHAFKIQPFNILVNGKKLLKVFKYILLRIFYGRQEF